MYRKITTGLATALVLVSSLAVGVLTAASPALARTHRHHHAGPAHANSAAIVDHARNRSSNDVPFAPF